MRLKSMFAAIPVMIGSFLGYAWTAQEKVRRFDPVSTRSALESDFIFVLPPGAHCCAGSFPLLRWFLHHGDLREVSLQTNRNKARRRSDLFYLSVLSLSWLTPTSDGRQQPLLATVSSEG